MKDLYDNNFRFLKKEIEDLRKWRDLPCSWIGRIDILKYGHSTKGKLQIQCNPHQNPNTLLQRHGKNNSQINLERQKTKTATTKKNRIAKIILNKRTAGESSSMTSSFTAEQ